MKIHDDAFMALIRTAPDLTNSTFEGLVTGKPPRYVSVFPRETRAINRFTGPHGVIDNEYVVHAVGNNPAQAKRAREAMIDAVLDVTPNVTGWNSRRVRFITSQPLATDNDPAPSLWYTVDVLAYESERL